MLFLERPLTNIFSLILSHVRAMTTTKSDINRYQLGLQFDSVALGAMLILGRKGY